MTLLAGGSCQCVVPLELCFYPEEGDTIVTLARFWPALHGQVLTPARLLTSHHYRHIHHCVKIHNGGVKKTVRLFSEVMGQEATGTNFEIQGIQFRNKKKLFYHECSNIGTGCLESLASPSWEIFKTEWDKVLSRCWTQWSPDVLANLDNSVVLWAGPSHPSGTEQFAPKVCLAATADVPQATSGHSHNLFPLWCRVWNLLTDSACSLRKARVGEEDRTPSLTRTLTQLDHNVETSCCLLPLRLEES